MGKQALLLVPGRAGHQIVHVVFVHPQRQRGEGIGDQINPQNMAGLQGRGDIAGDGRKHGHNLAEVGGEQKQHGFFYVLVDAPPLLDGLLDGGKIIVGQDNVRRLLRHVCAAQTHGHADVDVDKRQAPAFKRWPRARLNAFLLMLNSRLMISGLTFSPKGRTCLLYTSRGTRCPNRCI